MSTFGAYLKERGVISAAQLDEATRSRVVFGGRLGTNLIELGYLELADVGRHLAGFLEVPVAPREWLEHPETDALRKISKDLAKKYRVLPLHHEKRNLHLAMLDPRDPMQLDEIAFATGLRIVPYVVPEVELLAMLEHRYDIDREDRFVDLDRDTAAMEQDRQEYDFEIATVGETAALEAVRPILKAGDASQDLLNETTFSPLQCAGSGKDKPVEVPPAQRNQAPEVEGVPLAVGDIERPALIVPRKRVSIALLEAQLLDASDRDAVSECVLRLARRYCTAAALFVVRGGIVSGFRGDGEGVPEQIREILLPVESDCAITQPAKTRLPFRGLPPESGLDATLLDSIGRSGIAAASVHPVLIRGLVVNLLYTDTGSNEQGDTQFAALEVVARMASAAYERLILRAKSRFDTASVDSGSRG